MSDPIATPSAIPGSTFGVGGINDIVVRTLLIPLHSVSVMLPATAVAEVATAVTPTAETDRQPWYIGTALWRGVSVPLVSYNVMLGLPETELLQDSRIIIINGIMGRRELPFYSILATGIPRLFQARKEVMTINAAAEDDSELIANRVFVGEEEFYLPDLDNIENMLISMGARVR